MSLAIFISYCGDHLKAVAPYGFEAASGSTPGSAYLPASLHARMLEDTVKYLYTDCTCTSVNAATFICASRFRGFDVEDPGERKRLWEISRFARFVTTSKMLNHTDGACWAIGMAIEAASELGFERMIFTAEDVILPRGLVAKVAEHLLSSDYCGTIWGNSKENLNAQVFGCRVEPFAKLFPAYKNTSLAQDDEGVPIIDVEVCLRRLVRENRLRERLMDAPCYMHTHNPQDHHRIIRHQLGAGACQLLRIEE